MIYILVGTEVVENVILIIFHYVRVNSMYTIYIYIIQHIREP
jgi:hypothetical protein